MLWIWPVITVAAVAVVVFFLTSEMAGSTRGAVARTFVCPQGKEVTAVFESDFFEPRRYRDVLSCSRFAAGQPVACDKACLDLGKEAIAAQDAVRLPVWIA
jgi:hypothetical protein